jgi:hypothetical protein
MSDWVLECSNCQKVFTHSMIDETGMLDYFWLSNLGSHPVEASSNVLIVGPRQLISVRILHTKLNWPRYPEAFCFPGSQIIFVNLDPERYR